MFLIPGIQGARKHESSLHRPAGMNARFLIGALALVVATLLVWELRWVLLILFGAVVLAVALDVPITWLRRLFPLQRPAALGLVVGLLLGMGGVLSALLLPEVIEQVELLQRIIPRLPAQITSLIREFPALEKIGRAHV